MSTPFACRLPSAPHAPEDSQQEDAGSTYEGMLELFRTLPPDRAMAAWMAQQKPPEAYAQLRALLAKPSVARLTPLARLIAPFSPVAPRPTPLGVGLELRTCAQAFEEDRAHFGAWAVSSSPLILGAGCAIPRS